MSGGISTPVKRRGILASSKLRTACSTRAGDHFLNPRHDTRYNYVDAGGVGVQTVGLIEFGVAGYPVEEEWIKDDRMSRGKRRKDRIEGLHVVGTEIARCLHTRQQDSNMTVLKLVQNGVERRLGKRRVNAAQRVIGAEFDNYCLGSLRHRPVEPA